MEEWSKEILKKFKEAKEEEEERKRVERENYEQKRNELSRLIPVIESITRDVAKSLGGSVFGSNFLPPGFSFTVQLNNIYNRSGARVHISPTSNWRDKDFLYVTISTEILNESFRNTRRLSDQSERPMNEIYLLLLGQPFSERWRAFYNVSPSDFKESTFKEILKKFCESAIFGRVWWDSWLSHR